MKNIQQMFLISASVFLSFLINNLIAEELPQRELGRLVVLEHTTLPKLNIDLSGLLNERGTLAAELIGQGSQKNIAPKVLRENRVRQVPKEIGEPETFSQGSELKTFSVNKEGAMVITMLTAGDSNTSDTVAVWAGADKVGSLELYSASQENFDYIENHPNNYEKAIVNKGPNWFLIDSTKIVDNSSGGNSLSPMANNGSEQTITDPENGGLTLTLRGICGRDYDLQSGTGHPYHYGINIWNIPNPIASGFSLKQEFSNSLRCPNRNPNQQENFIDGVYRRGWGVTALSKCQITARPEGTILSLLAAATL